MRSWFRKPALNRSSVSDLPPELLMQFADVRALRDKDRGHTALIGSTGSGKSTNLEILIKSTLGHVPDSLEVVNAFVFDPQNDLYRPIMSMDLPLKVVLTNVLDDRGYAWDMARDVRDPAGAWQFAYAALPPDRTSGENRFFDEAPRHIFAAVTRELVNMRHPWTLRIAYLIAMDDRYAEELIRRSNDPGVRQTLRLFNGEQGTTRANIDSSLLTKLANLQTYAALMEHAAHRFSLDQVVRSDVVLIAGGDFQFSHVVAPMNYLLLTVLKQKIIGQEKSDARRHYVYIDEFAALNHDRPADEVLDFFVRSRSRGGRVTIAIHTPQQLVDLYGPHKAAVILGQTQNKLIFRVDDLEGAEWCSKMLGYVHEYEWTQSSSVGGSSNGVEGSSNWSRNANESYVDRPMVHMDEIRKMPLASFGHGIHGYGILPGPRGVDRWRFHLTPEWLADHAVEQDPGIPSYESRRRPGRHQRLVDLTRAEVEGMGLTYHEDAKDRRRP